MTLGSLKMQNVYGLGEQFVNPGEANGDWLGKIRSPGNKYGNAHVPFNGGYNGNAQFPILYALGPGGLNYSFFVDCVYPLNWDFTTSTWNIQRTLDGSDNAFRAYFF